MLASLFSRTKFNKENVFDINNNPEIVYSNKILSVLVQKEKSHNINNIVNHNQHFQAHVNDNVNNVPKTIHSVHNISHKNNQDPIVRNFS